MAPAEVIVERLTDTGEVLERCADLFAEEPAASNMAAASVAQGSTSEVLVAHDDGRTLGAAVRRPEGWTLSRLDRRAVDPLADALDGPTGLHGEVGTALAVAARWCDRTGGAFVPGEVFRFHVLGELRQPAAPGQLRPAVLDDAPLHERWAAAFDTDIGRPIDSDRSAVDRSAIVAGATGAGRLWTWRVDDVVTASAWTTLPVAGAVRIGRVYTPPEHRRHGYAAALTAAIAANQLGRPDVDTVLLTTQATNAATNRLYRRIGFAHVFNAIEVGLRV